MQYDEFIEKVKEYTALSEHDAIKVVRATLETLGERLSRTHREHLAAQLSQQFKVYVLLYPRTDLFPLEEFYIRVAARAGIKFHDAFRQAPQVMKVVREAIARGELEDILKEIPHEFDELLGRQPPLPSPPPLIDTHELSSKS